MYQIAKEGQAMGLGNASVHNTLASRINTQVKEKCIAQASVMLLFILGDWRMSKIRISLEGCESMPERSMKISSLRVSVYYCVDNQGPLTSIYHL